MSQDLKNTAYLFLQPFGYSFKAGFKNLKIVGALALDVSIVHWPASSSFFFFWCSDECHFFFLLDTNFLEFCLKQSRSEAEMLLIENLGSFDPDHEFIDKFLNYKELLPADVLEIAFQSRNDRKVTGFGAGDMSSDNAGVGEYDRDNTVGPDGSSKGGGKKKGKKGKKVSPSVLGFSVVSNRIMMGEIQTLED